MSATFRSAAVAIQTTRAFPLDDLTIRSGGDGRTVEAYAAVFDSPTEIHDQDGHYTEELSRSSFNKTLADRGTRFGVFYNHAMTLHGTPSERGSMPLGTPLEVRADNRGVLTVTRYNKTEQADDVLEAIRNGDIRGQSFTGRMIRSTPQRGSRPFRASSDGSLTTVRRDEIALIEYGPTPFPAYEAAAITGVRSIALDQAVDVLLASLRDGDRDLDAFARSLRSISEEAVEQARNFIAGTPADEEPAFLARLQALATRLGAPVEANATEAPAAAGALTLRAHQVRARLAQKGLRYGDS